MYAQRWINEFFDNSLQNKLVESDVPSICKNKPCILGIDEAGRGPVLGPMTYGIAYYPQEKEDLLSKMKFADSKTLSESSRENLFESLDSKAIGYMIKIIAPNMISNSMLRRNKYNLNALSHDTAIDLIKSVEARGIKIAHVYIDTVGPADKYKIKMKSFFPNYQFTIAEKADSKYTIVSAASICAKVMRDRIVNDWKFPEAASLHLDTFDLGSGYPADPVTKEFLVRSIDPVFGYPTLARFSWSTIQKLLADKACKCDWNEPDDEEQKSKQPVPKNKSIKRFFVPMNRSSSLGGGTSSTTPKQQPSTNRTMADIFFDARLLSVVNEWDI